MGCPPGGKGRAPAQSSSEDEATPEQEVMSLYPVDKQEALKVTPRDKPPSERCSSSPGESAGCCHQRDERKSVMTSPYLQLALNLLPFML